jgi:hypothetical protein
VVLIVKKIQRKRCDFVFIPVRILNDMLDRHVHRKGLIPSQETTCLVDATGEKIPSDNGVIKLLIDTLKLRPLEEGEGKYPFASASIRCREYQHPNWAISAPYKGSFAIRLERIKGRSRAVQKALELERLNKAEIESIQGAFRHVPVDKCQKGEFVFIMKHVHPSRRGSIIERLIHQ